MFADFTLLSGFRLETFTRDVYVSDLTVNHWLIRKIKQHYLMLREWWSWEWWHSRKDQKGFPQPL